MAKPPSFLKRTFYIRVAVLLTILVGVLLWALGDVRRRRARNEWDHTLYVSIALVRLETIDDASIEALRARVPALEDRLTSEMARYHPGLAHPFKLSVIAPVNAPPPPPAPTADGPVAVTEHALDLSRWVKKIDASAAIEPDLYDVRIYVAIRRPRQAERTIAEGRGEQGGRIGVVEVELDPQAVDLPLIVVAHELMHTLGATDKYDASGHTSIPLGLAEPERVPRFPQRFAEIMSRNRPLSATEERVPDTLEQVAVGPTTAHEIGWLR